jgi:MFS transporter, DHA2 family, multidrug resistance protein
MPNSPATASDSTARSDRIAALRSVLPADLSHSPLLGILGVIMGAGISSLAARLLSLGLTDLRGQLGIGFDEGAWIATAFNTATVFIGPLTVYLGALLGARRILLVGSVLFAIVSACLPFVHSYSLLIVLVAIAGFSSGTFYPLTIGFALLNVPLRYLALTLGVYATCIEGALNFAPSLYGFYRDHWSWAWMFWTSALVAPIMTACVYYGVPASRQPAPSGPKPSFAGFLYFSAGIALLFAALDQGQRLDWWRSGVFTALVASGLFLVLCAIARRMRAPNPFVDLPYLRQWNTIAAAVALFAFRFVLLATALLIPQSLSFRGLDATQYGPAVLWTAMAEMFLAVFAAQLLNKGLDSRLLMALGFATIAAVCLVNGDFTRAWAAENYFRTELVMAVGQSFAFVGIVSTLILQALFSGGLESPYRVLTFSSFIHLVRIFGGQLGTTSMSRFIAEQEKLHSYLLGLHVQTGNWVTEHTVSLVTAGLAARSSGTAGAAGRAVGLVAGGVRLEAYTLAFIDAFHLIAWASVATLILIATLRRFPMNYRDLAALDAGPPAARTRGQS